MLTHRAYIIIFVSIVVKMLCCKGIFLQLYSLLLLVEVVKLYITGAVVCFKQVIVLFGARTAVCGDGLGSMAIELFQAFDMGGQCECIGWVWKGVVIGNDLIVGTYLNIVAWLIVKKSPITKKKRFTQL